MLYVLAAWPVTLFAANVPLRHLFGVDVVVDGVASIAGWAGRPLHIVRRIVWLPPVSSLGDEIWPPNSMANIPLRRLGKVIVSSLREVTLLPKAAVNQCDLVFCEFGNGIRREIGNDGVRMVARIANHIRHGGFSPVFVNLRVALLAGLRARVVSRLCRGRLLGVLLTG